MLYMRVRDTYPFSWLLTSTTGRKLLLVLSNLRMTSIILSLIPSVACTGVIIWLTVKRL